MPSSHELFVDLAGITSVAGLALKDQLKLRWLLLVGIAFQIVAHSITLKAWAWTDLFWNGVALLINVVVLVQLILDRTHVGLSAEEEELFKAFHSLTPGEFRALVKLARWETAGEGQVLTIEGVMPDDLFYVLHGGIHLEKAGRRFQIDPRAFIGEVAFLHACPATATVKLEAGSRYLRWPVKSLEGGFNTRNGLRVAVMRLIGLDMAIKVARA